MNDAAPEGPDGGDPFDQCPGVDHTADGIRDIDIEAISLAGFITLNGEPLPEASGGSIAFRKIGTLSELRLPLDAGVNNYSVTLSPGVYDLLFLPDASLCERPADTPMPCVSGTLLTGVTLTTDGVFDVDIPVVRLSGTVDLCNADGSGCRVLPDESMNRGALRFVHEAGMALSAPFAATGAVSYDIGLLPGSYGVELAANQSLCESTTPPEVPCINASLGEVTIAADGVFDFDIPALQLSGGVRLCAGDGSGCVTLPDETINRGALLFSLEGGGTVSTSPFAATGPVSYSLTLVPGSYTVDLQANPELCGNGTLPSMPCGGGWVLGPVMLSADGVLDVDLPTVTVTGQARLCDANGASCTTMPDEPKNRGSLYFERAQGGDVNTAAFGSGGAATYALRLLAGEYTIHFIANGGLCDMSSAPSVPCVGGQLQTGVSLRNDGVYDAAIGAVQLTGIVTLCDASGSNCSALPDESRSRGALSFNLDRGAALNLPLGATGPFSYAVTLMPGPYEITYESSDSSCEAGSQMPCLRGALITSAIATSGVLDVAIPTLTVSGRVTLEGGTLPDSFDTRGNVTYALLGGGVAQYALAVTGADSYSVRLIPGKYIIAHGANENLCDGTTAPLVPCTDTINAGCGI